MSYKDWDISPEEISAAYQSKLQLEKTLRADIKDLYQIIYSMAGSKQEGIIAIDTWYDNHLGEAK